LIPLASKAYYNNKYCPIIFSFILFISLVFTLTDFITTRDLLGAYLVSFNLVSLKPHCSNFNIKPVFAGAAISGLFAIFYDGSDYFRIKNISDNEEARKLLKSVGLEVYGIVPSIKQTARNSLAKSDKRSNVV
jgi:hypothetical protein